MKKKWRVYFGREFHIITATSARAAAEYFGDYGHMSITKIEEV